MNGVNSGSDDSLQYVKDELERLEWQLNRANRIDAVARDELSALIEAANNDPCLAKNPEHIQKIKDQQEWIKDIQDIKEKILHWVERARKLISILTGRSDSSKSASAAIAANPKKLQGQSGKDGKRGVQGNKGRDASATTGQSKVCKK
jgi:hypothetical protein